MGDIGGNVAPNKHHQIRFVKRINDDRQVITFTKLGFPYESHDQKTLKSYHTLDEVVARAKEYNPELPPNVKGMVILRFQAGGGRISIGKKVKSYVGTNTRGSGTTEWLLYIDREGNQFNIVEGTHKLSR